MHLFRYLLVAIKRWCFIYHSLEVSHTDVLPSGNISRRIRSNKTYGSVSPATSTEYDRQAVPFTIIPVDPQWTHTALEPYPNQR